jgi:AcrR family transcriptional regulator
VAKAGPSSQVATRVAGRSARTRELLVDAAVGALIDDGFIGASARSIADRAGLNQGLIFYHYGSVMSLLLAALDQVSTDRMAVYGQAVADASTPTELVDVAARIFQNDLESGYVKVLVEMIAGASSPELRTAVAARIPPWFAFAEGAIGGAMPAALASLLPTGDVAYAVVALYLGLELLTHLDGDDAPTTRLFALASQLTTMFSAMPNGSETQVLR